MEIPGSTALVTGANRGIGRALVDALLDRGARRVYAASRTTQSHPDERVIALQLDITDAAQISAAAARATDVTLLVNNAGSLAFTDALTGDLASVESDWRTNYLGTLAMSRAFSATRSAQITRSASLAPRVRSREQSHPRVGAPTMTVSSHVVPGNRSPSHRRSNLAG